MAHTCIPSPKKGSNEQLEDQSQHPLARKKSWNEPIEAMLTTFDAKDVVLLEYVPNRQTVIDAFYWEVLERLKEKVNGMRPSVVSN
ncbi:hypothetical protein NPIL_191861 [Nephila pilipes]|uniref:Uncharacterized protein n=1 Tax=Nephila pilipes TaxID=299642 RepID=A0A8X6QJ18_NEPPI|nr:hypothetical protein NPIL_191861 [Nephila pilipes]